MKGHHPRAALATVRTSGLRAKNPAPPAVVEALLDPNDALTTELCRLPGIGPKLAARIVDSRTSAGRFASLSDLTRVPGVNAKLVDRIKDRLVLRDPPRAAEPCSLEAAPCSTEAEPCSLEAEPCSLEEEPCVVEAEPFSIEPDERTAFLMPRSPRTGALHWPGAPTTVLAPSAGVHEEVKAEPCQEAEPQEVVAVSAPPSPRPNPAAAAAPAAPAWMVEDRPPTRPQRLHFAGIAAMVVAAAFGGALFGGRDQGFAKHGEVQTWSADVRALQVEQEHLRGRLDRVEPAGAQLPQVAARCDILDATMQAQLKEAQANVQRLSREVAQLREQVWKDQKDAERRGREVRGPVEGRASIVAANGVKERR
jgi:competence protein ComEA